MKKTITITAHNRPDYFVRVLETLAQNVTIDWEIYISIEPTGVRPEMITLAETYFPDVNLFLPPHKYGVRGNPYTLLSHVFSYVGSDFNLYLEEDIIVSPDVCHMANWYIEQECPEACLCLCNLIWTSGGDMDRLVADFDSNILNEPPESIVLALDEFNPSVNEFAGKATFSTCGFSALGIVLSKDTWDRNFQPHWGSDCGNLYSKGGWDWSIATHFVDNNLKTLVPYQSRSDHIGDWGTHSGGNRDQGLFGHRPISMENIDRNSVPYKVYHPTGGKYFQD